MNWYDLDMFDSMVLSRDGGWANREDVEDLILEKEKHLNNFLIANEQIKDLKEEIRELKKELKEYTEEYYTEEQCKEKLKIMQENYKKLERGLK